MAPGRRSFLVTVLGPDADGFQAVVAVDEAGDQVSAVGSDDGSLDGLLKTVAADLASAAAADGPRFR